MSERKVIPLACDMAAIPPAEREHHRARITHLFSCVQHIDELEDGYRFHLSHGDDIVQRTAEFITAERLCCPFFQFELHIDGRNVWLSLRGPDGIKPFIHAELGHAVRNLPPVTMD